MDSRFQNGVAKPLSASEQAARPSIGGQDEPTQNSSQHESSSLRDRWESAFVWSFIIRFTDLKGKIEGLENIDDFEEATQENAANPIILAILARFIENLYPKANTKPQFISQTLFNIVSDKCGASERSVWWDLQANRNIHPLSSDSDFFLLPSDLKVEILRQLVEWQLSHNESVRNILDCAYGVQRGAHRKKLDGGTKDVKEKQKVDVITAKQAAKRQKRNSQTPPETNGDEDRTVFPARPEDDPHSRTRMQMAPLGVDRNRKRYWAVDESPRLYLSGNPWKWTCPFKTIASTRDEYMAVIDRLKAEQTPMKSGAHRGKFERSHDELISLLEGERLTRIDSELFRLSKVKQRIKERQYQRQKQAEKLKVLAELRTTRTRVKTKKVDYVYDLGSDDERALRGQSRGSGHAEDGDYLDDNIMEDADEEEFGDEQIASGSRQSLRLSGRISTTQPIPENGRSGRRSTRSTGSHAGPPKEHEADQDYQPKKRRRLSSAASDDSRSLSMNHASSSSSTQEKVPNGAAVIKPHEKVVETISGRKKSKFWFYAVEEVPGGPPANGVGDVMSVESTTSGASTTAVEGVEGDLKALEIQSVPSTASHHGDGGTPEESDMYVDG